MNKPRLVSNKFKNLINNMRNICIKTVGRYRLAAVLLSGNKPITNTFAINDGLFHAEMKTISLYKNHKFRNIYNYPRKWDIIVIRLSADGILCNSKPCEDCLKEMYKYNIKGIYYINDNGELVYESILNISTSHISNGNKQKYLQSHHRSIYEINSSLIKCNKKLLGINHALLSHNKIYYSKHTMIRRNNLIIKENNKIIESNNKHIEENNKIIGITSKKYLFGNGDNE